MSGTIGRASPPVVGIARKEASSSVDHVEKKSQAASTTYALVAAMEAKDPFSKGHSAMVSRIVASIGREMGLSESVIQGLQIAALLHDVGKIGVPGEVLNKPGRLTRVEWEMVKGHVEQGARILHNVSFPWPVKTMVYQHHERLDGSGYPRGVWGEHIILEARIMAVADVFEAMTSHRPYRPAASLEETLEHLQQNAGTKFDPTVVSALLNVVAQEGKLARPDASGGMYIPPASLDVRPSNGTVHRRIQRRITRRVKSPTAMNRSARYAAKPLL